MVIEIATKWVSFKFEIDLEDLVNLFELLTPLLGM